MPKHDSKGNPINKEGRFFALQNHMMNSDAWASLTPQEVAVYLRVAYRLNGANNAQIALGVRDAANEANVSRNTAGKALKNLCSKGFLQPINLGGFSTNGGKATTYALTCLPIKKGKPASREYQNWKPSLKNKTQSQMGATAVVNGIPKPKLRLVN